jgi:subtilisin family serine protease
MNVGASAPETPLQRCVGAVAAIVLAFAMCQAVLAQGDAPLTAKPPERPAAKPPVPPGLDPGGIAIALIATGVDYTHPEIRDRLARDGEGEIVGIDLIDNDHRPFASSLSGNRDGIVDTILARRILATYRHARLVPIRVDPKDKAMLARALAFAATTPARIVAVPLWSDNKETWEFFQQAADQIPDLLLILPAGDADAVAQGRPQWPGALNLKGAVIVATVSETIQRGTLARPGAPRIDALLLGRGESMFPGIVPQATDSAEAVALAAGLAACAQHNATDLTAQQTRERMLALAVRAEGPRNTPVLDPLCLYGGKRH